MRTRQPRTVSRSRGMRLVVTEEGSCSCMERFSLSFSLSSRCTWCSRDCRAASLCDSWLSRDCNSSFSSVKDRTCTWYIWLTLNCKSPAGLHSRKTLLKWATQLVNVHFHCNKVILHKSISEFCKVLLQNLETCCARPPRNCWNGCSLQHGHGIFCLLNCRNLCLAIHKQFFLNNNTCEKFLLPITSVVARFSLELEKHEKCARLTGRPQHTKVRCVAQWLVMKWGHRKCCHSCVKALDICGGYTAIKAKGMSCKQHCLCSTLSAKMQQCIQTMRLFHQVILSYRILL